MYLSIIVPVYNEEDNIAEFISRTAPVLKGLTHEYEIIFVLDPCTDRTEQIIRDFTNRDQSIKLLKLSRRFGQPRATEAGLYYSKGDAVIVMDVDLQDPPELIPQMVEKWKEGYDVVCGKRSSREGEPFTRTLMAGLFYKLMNKIADLPIPENTGDFRLLSRRAVDQLCLLKESHGFLRGLVALVGFPQTSVSFSRPGRHAGTTHYNQLLGSIRIAMNGLVGFSGALLRLSTFAGATVGFLAVLAVFSYVASKLMAFPFPISHPLLVFLILFMASIQLLCIGILGEYIYRIYDEVRMRPKFIVDQAIGFRDLDANKMDRAGNLVKGRYQ